MANVTPTALLNAAKARFGEGFLRGHILNSGNDAARDAELLKIAAGVLNVVQAACQAYIGWPIPGAWPAGSISPVDGSSDVSGQNYADVWPGDLWNHALNLINWRAWEGFEGVPLDVRKIGQGHELYFTQLGQGAISIGIGGATDGGEAPKIAVSRDRFGKNLLNDGARDQPYVSDSMHGIGWDFAR